MSWNSGPHPQGGVPPNQGYYGGPPPQQPYPGAYPPPGGYPGAAPGGYPGAPPAGYPGAPPAGYPGAPPPTSFPPSGPGFGPGYGPGVPPGPPPQQPGVYGGAYPEEDMEVKGFGFSDKTIRRGFIRKVYSILMVQLSVSMVFIAWFLYHEPTKYYVQHHLELFYIAMALTFVFLIAIVCCEEMRRRPPTNYVFLFLFTLVKSFMLATVTSLYTADSVFFAVGLTVVICLALTLFAFQTKYDFTMCGGVLLVCSIVLLLLGLVSIIWPGYALRMVYASLGAILFSFYLIYDTQLMMGGKHKYALSPEEYIFAALSLYIDIVNLFMYLLALVGSRD